MWSTIDENPLVTSQVFWAFCAKTVCPQTKVNTLKAANFAHLNDLSLLHLVHLGGLFVRRVITNSRNGSLILRHDKQIICLQECFSKLWGRQQRRARLTQLALLAQLAQMVHWNEKGTVWLKPKTWFKKKSLFQVNYLDNEKRTVRLKPKKN